MYFNPIPSLVTKFQLICVPNLSLECILLILTLKLCPDSIYYFYQLLSAHSPLVTVLPLLGCKNVLIPPALYSVESKDIHWYRRKLCPSLVTHSTAIPEQAASPTPIAAGFLPLLCPLLGFLCELAKSSSTLLQELELLVLPFSCHFFPFQRTWCLTVFYLSSAEPRSSWLRR